MAHPIIVHLGVQTADSSKTSARERIALASRSASISWEFDLPDNARKVDDCGRLNLAA
jgi:hypothetical protein